MGSMSKSTTQYHAVVDMGSNGIRCSVSDLSRRTLRLLPSVYQTRIPISLHDAQHPDKKSERSPLDGEAIHKVVAALKRFKITCEDFEVPKDNVIVVATEATRTALNASELLDSIKKHVGWDVTLLSKQQEAAAGAIGIALSLPRSRGLFMDLGGGSVQLGWMDTHQLDWPQKLAKNATSLPYGAAALLQRLGSTKSSTEKQSELRKEVSDALRTALADLGLDKCKNTEGKLDLFLSGGGFRGWGYLLMALRSPYPISWINGFQVSPDEFLGIECVDLMLRDKEHHCPRTQVKKSEKDDMSIFRVSPRRLEQLPATMFLIKCLSSVLPDLNRVTFCQGGTQMGTLLNQIDPEQRAVFSVDSALDHAVAHVTDGVDKDYEKLASIISDGLPKHMSPGTAQKSQFGLLPQVLEEMIPAFTMAIHHHRPLPKDIRPLSALHFTSTAFLGAAIGLTHFQRAALALMLAERWGGRSDLPPEEQRLWDQMVQIVGPQSAWWCRYIGRVGAFLGEVWPAGLYGHLRGEEGDTKSQHHGDPKRISMCSGFTQNHVNLLLREGQQDILSTEAIKAFERIGKLGKRKNWVSAAGQEPWGIKVHLDIQRHG